MRQALLRAGQEGGVAQAEAHVMHAEARALKEQHVQMEQRAYLACEAMADYHTRVNHAEGRVEDHVRMMELSG